MLPNMVVEVAFKTSLPLALAYFQVIITKYIYKLIVEGSFSLSLSVQVLAYSVQAETQVFKPHSQLKYFLGL